MENYLLAISAREREWTRRFATPIRRTLLFSKSKAEILPQEHLQLLDKYDALVSHLVPPQEIEPILRHPDLHLGNIFIDPDSKKISGIIDWQGAMILPLFIHSGFPPMVNNDGKRLSNPLVRPSPPDLTNIVEGPEKELLLYNYIQQLGYHLYLAATGKWNPVHFQALRRPYLPIRKIIVQQAGYPWDGDLLSLRAALIGVTQAWENLSKPGESCPVHFTDDETNQHSEEKAEWDDACSCLTMLRDMLGINVQGWVTAEMFQATVEENQRLKKQLIMGAERDEREEAWKTWPFKDDDDTSDSIWISF